MAAAVIVVADGDLARALCVATNTPSALAKDLSMKLASSLSLVLVACVVGCSSSASETTDSSSHADTSAATSIVACAADGHDASCPAGSFAVSCLDGSHQVATVTQIELGQVCTTPCPLGCPESLTCGGNGVPGVCGFGDLAAHDAYCAKKYGTLPTFAPSSTCKAGSCESQPFPNEDFACTADLCWTTTGLTCVDGTFLH
jgi:hypothetical protein